MAEVGMGSQSYSLSTLKMQHQQRRLKESFINPWIRETSQSKCTIYTHVRTNCLLGKERRAAVSAPWKFPSSPLGKRGARTALGMENRSLARGNTRYNSCEQPGWKVI